ncbi:MULTISPECIES: aldo/keto reductase [Rhizobium]|uniref:Aldo/keto reductase n=1 Tax=Rhizobium rhododendri TaxID=2506430 RepID=A0ABY8IER0_9HYPH|nr:MULTISPECIES: aldo/keto reductase [Rhizobium]MBZ5759257.1 aldo/keto reductase [Rhizobium sp. VS19-DR96]MBZ5763912.1 aldo/keto reductase [Rhizobium sp. VS19-DR129.2]MBZ5771456.1 aldo/keto reductase [Rhizobium sp. VS19-DRK62.2]MBZ5783857.1 aldo/keto reductase [Rhizobium sp. VS19-DR121]MBZ5801469.1 aldo/keto reductase [Rhizobium sp. VS19-DR181]
MTKTFELRPGYAISRVIRGGWQLAGGHGAIDRDQAVTDLIAAYDAGIRTYDCADIYTGVEELIGAARDRLRNERGAEAAAEMKVHTKLVPDLEKLGNMNRDYIRGIVEQSLRRLRTERLDLVQFHWWDYSLDGYLDALGWLNELHGEGKVRNVGTTNFDTQHVAEILKAGIPLVSQQLQYSVLDQRPANSLTALAAANDVKFLCYGSVAGGFLSDKWLGQPEPEMPLENRSLVKYKLIIDDFGGWDLFQSLLSTLKVIGDRHGVDIATVASAWVLRQPQVAAVIVGARNQAHALANAGIMDIVLSADDMGQIEAIIAESKGPLGDVYTLERDRNGRHGSIMHYNLNAGKV